MLAGRPVARIGYGAMQLPGPGVLGPPRDRAAALALLRRAVELGVNASASLKLTLEYSTRIVTSPGGRSEGLSVSTDAVIRSPSWRATSA